MGHVAENRISVKVKFFAAPREALDVDEMTVEVSAGSTVRDLIEHLEEQHPVLKTYARFLNVAVNRAYVGMQTDLEDGDEVACLPPVGGG